MLKSLNPIKNKFVSKQFKGNYQKHAAKLYYFAKLLRPNHGSYHELRMRFYDHFK